LNTRIDRWIRPLAIITASLFTTSVATVGQVNSNVKKQDVLAQRVRAGNDATTDTSGATTTTTPLGAAGPLATIAGRPTTSTGGPNISGTAAVPNFGLRTQGVTNKEVTVGYSYNVAACGDAGTLQAALGSAVTGDPKKAIDAFTRYINDTGGIGGRTFKIIVEDDGGGDCPEKSKAAAVKMADEDKVFLAIPGLHIESDYLIEQKVPVFGGRDDAASLARAGANGIMLTEAIEPTLEKWTAFGKYYLDTPHHKPCMIHPESGVSGDWNAHEKTLIAKFKKYDMTFTDVITYQDDVSTAQQQATTIAARAKEKGCDQVFFMAINPIALIFFTQAATQNLWFPTWTFTSYMALVDTELAGRLMDRRQWENAIGLSTRVPPGQHPKEGNCRNIYNRYYGGEGQEDSAATQVVCAQLLTTAEIMRRAIKATGVLTGNSLMVGANQIQNNWTFDATVPLRYSFPGVGGPFKTKAFSHYTVVDWSSSESKYLFPEFPKYWETMGPNKSNAVDLRSYFGQS
jgi:hypothetical protein